MRAWLVLRGVEKKLGLAARLAGTIRDDGRKAERIEHPLEEMLRLRMFAIAAGYEDANDCEFAAGRSDLQDGGRPCAGERRSSVLAAHHVAAGERAVEDRDRPTDGGAGGWVLRKLPTSVPSSITLDIDDTCDTVHGHQQLSLFNAHYDERCFLPIHIYDAASGKPVAMILREGKTPSGEEVRTGPRTCHQTHPQASAQGPHPGARR